jgi:hypothetical protein
MTVLSPPDFLVVESEYQRVVVESPQLDGVLVIEDTEPLVVVEQSADQFVLVFEPDDTNIIQVDLESSFILMDIEAPPAVLEQSTNEDVILITSSGLPGPPGRDGVDGQDGVAAPFEYQMSAPATTATVVHDLGRDPVAVQVFDGGVLCNEYGFYITVPHTEVQLGFDVPVTALIRLL